MGNYKHILLAVDFFEQAQSVIDRAIALANINQASLSLIHIVEMIHLADSEYGFDGIMDADISNEMIAAAKIKLTRIGKELGVEQDRIWIEMGSPKLEINRIAEENQVDLIVVGSHGRHGLQLLLGSTANGVLRHAKCDVLAVSLNDH
ncbi:MAG: universal stress protein [Methyloglobulus sp.]|nr:universal stress protein [Methyloglobulus sp.]